MTTYLSMNGTLSDYLNLPNITIDSLEIDSEVYSGSQVQSIFGETQADVNVSTSNVVSSNNSSLTITQNITVGTRGILNFSLSPAYTVSGGNASIARGYGYYANYHAKMDIYDIKVYNAGVLVAHYDMSTGTVNDQSGNGNNATLYGGTWVNSSSGTTYIGSGTSQGTSSASSSEKVNYEESATSQGTSSVTNSENLILSTDGTSQSESSAQSSERVILSGSATSQGQSSSISSESLISHSGTTYSGSGSSQGTSSAVSNDKQIYSEQRQSHGVSQATSNESVSLSASAISQGQSSATSKETLISVNKIVSTITLQGNRELNVLLEGNRQLNVQLQGNRQLYIVLKGGVDVTVENQTLEMYAGEDKILDIPNITDVTNNNLNLTTCQSIWFIAKRGSGRIYKDLTTGVKVISPTEINVSLIPSDTANYVANFDYEIWCQDSQGYKSILTTGTLNIKQSLT